MKKIFFLSFITIISCTLNQVQKPLNSSMVEATSGEIILLGKINLANLQTSKVTPWFNEEFNRVKIDFKMAKTLKPLTKNLKIKVFMGTWCSDSQRVLPQFFKILTAMDFEQENLEMFAMSEEKNTPSNFEKDLKIYNVPTIIFFKNGKEINRFVESPVESLESDIKKIIEGEVYNHSYTL